MNEDTPAKACVALRRSSSRACCAARSAACASPSSLCAAAAAAPSLALRAPGLPAAAAAWPCGVPVMSLQPRNENLPRQIFSHKLAQGCICVMRSICLLHCHLAHCKRGCTMHKKN